MSRSSAFRPRANRDKGLSVYREDTSAQARSSSATLRPSPITAQSSAAQGSDPDSSSYSRRCTSVVHPTSITTPPGRSSTYTSHREGSSHGRMHNISPLTRTFDFRCQPGIDTALGVDGTESTTSTAAPSTVWDELDDLKSRIHRLELTGKLPPASGALGWRLSDERPATATTTVTTDSFSPTRNNRGQAAESGNLLSSPRESHPILHSALIKLKHATSADVYRALESVVYEAAELSALLGPNKSAALANGSGMTDRQLRRKADGVCRSLTELCLAIGEDSSHLRLPPSHSATSWSQMDGPSTPTIPKSYSGLSASRRSSIMGDSALPRSSSSPRVMSRLEERRSSLLNGSALPPLRTTTGTANGDSAMGRMSSLMLARNRRACTEEPEDGRASSLLRRRRAETVDPEDGRASAFLIQGRRKTVGEEGKEATLLRAPSRANVGTSLVRGPGRGDYVQELQSPPSQSSIGLPRRRLSRLAAPSGSSSAPARRYMERPAALEGDTVGDGTSNGAVDGPDAGPTPTSQLRTHTRASSLSSRRQKRDSIIYAAPTSATTPSGTYR